MCGLRNMLTHRCVVNTLHLCASTPLFTFFALILRFDNWVYLVTGLYIYIFHTHLKTLARDVAKLGIPNDTSMALPLSGARAANPSTVPRMVPGRICGIVMPDT